jgi:2-keto-4-pentenoate hydratase/2-oxohepta-3-ene-1,7-dioic acid hydratase in catechol pathway
MRFVTYVIGSGEPRAGLAIDGEIADLEAGAAAIGKDLPSTILEFLRLGDAGMAIARDVEATAKSAPLDLIPEADVTLTAAIPNPPTIFLLAGNYQAHIMESGAAAVDKAKITPRPFIKPGTAVIGTGDPIRIPEDSDTLDYEIEIAAVIGKPGRHIPEATTDDHVTGYTVFNDVSARSLKIAENRKEREGDSLFDWLLGKWCDSFAAVGPYLVTRDEAGDPGMLEMALKVNGELRQHSSAGEMIFSISETIAFLSRFVTLRAGDLLCMGTPGGVGAASATYLKAGDLVEAEIEKLGALVNRVE